MVENPVEDGYNRDMPTYVYQCENCQRGFEEVQSFHDEALSSCPSCYTESLRRVPQLCIGIVRKGDSECTLGSLADRNESRFSDDQKHHIRKKNNDKIGIKRASEKKKEEDKPLKLSKFKSAEQVNTYVETGKLPY